MAALTRTRPADWTWTMIISNGLAYQAIAMILGEELLSAAAIRYRTAHPVIWRLFVIVVCGHLGGLLPYWADVFSERNPAHTLLARYWPRWAVITNRIAEAKEGYPPLAAVG